MESQLKLDALDTTYVSLGALMRHLREKEFRGRLHIVLDGYEADVFLYGPEPPSVWEKDLSTGRESRGEEAQQRLLVRAREPGGLITIYEGRPDIPVTSKPSLQIESESDPSDQRSLAQLVESSAELIAAVERAVQSTGIEFAQVFRRTRIELGDDYPFIDPTVGGFEYANGKVILNTNPAPVAYVQALTVCLKRVVNHVAQEKGGLRFRERVAVEFAIAARRKPGCLGEFEPLLDRVAGTRAL